jgi:hypothetical protein
MQDACATNWSVLFFEDEHEEEDEEERAGVILFAPAGRFAMIDTERGYL